MPLSTGLMGLIITQPNRLSRYRWIPIDNRKGISLRDLKFLLSRLREYSFYLHLLSVLCRPAVCHHWQQRGCYYWWDFWLGGVVSSRLMHWLQNHPPDEVKQIWVHHLCTKYHNRAHAKYNNLHSYKHPCNRSGNIISIQVFPVPTLVNSNSTITKVLQTTVHFSFSILFYCPLISPFL
jgi:hypothetical protein